MKAVLIKNSSDSEDEDDSIKPSFMTATNEDVFAAGSNHSVVPDVRRNILSEINNMEATVAPSAPDKEFLQVFLRVKPKTAEEMQLAKDEGYEESEVVKMESDEEISLTAPSESKSFKTSVVTGKMTHHYSFTKIFKPLADQTKIFSDVVMPRLKEFLEGRNQLLFTYGATGAGKTFTIQGSANEPGIMPNSFQTLFKSIEGKVCSDIPLVPFGYNSMVPAQQGELAARQKEKESVFRLGQELDKVRALSPTPSLASNVSQLSTASTASTASKGLSVDSLEISDHTPLLATSSDDSIKLSVSDDRISYSVWISFAEIYNEQVYDLFQRVPVDNKKKGEKVKRQTLKLAQDRNGHTFIKDLTEFQVDSADEAFRALSIGRQNLQFAATKLNQESSRSHCIFTIKIARVADARNPHLARVSLFSFCDLAGSERISKTQNTGIRLKEASNINTSLLVLGRCIKTIRANQQNKSVKKSTIPPFRESKLTRLMKDYLAGSGKASLLVCVSQAPYLFDESLHVLKFAAIASKVTVEEFKEPEPVPPPAKRTRFSSMVTAGEKHGISIINRDSRMSCMGRDSTIQWAPSSRSTMLPHLHRGNSSLFAPPARSTMCMPALPSITVSDAANESADETTMADATMIPAENYNNLVNIMEEMVDKLKAEKKRSRELEADLKKQETRLRSELCTEFNRLLVETEENYKDQLEKVADREREYGQWRVDALMKEMERKKRKRDSSSCEEDDSGQEKQLEAVREQLNNQEAEIISLKEQLDEAAQVEKALKDTLSAAGNGRDQLKKQNLELQQQFADQRKLADELGKELSATRDRLDSEQKLNAEKFENEEGEISNLKLQVSNLLADLAKKNDECTDMKDLLQEAGDEFLAKQEEVEQLGAAVKQLEGQLAQQGLVLGDVEAQLEESHILLREINDQMEDKESRIEELEEKLEEMNQMNKIKEERCVTAEKYLDELKKELEDCKEELSQKGRDNSYEKIQALQEEKHELQMSKGSLLAELADLKSERHNSKEMELKIQCSELKNDLQESEKTISRLQEELATSQDKQSSLRGELDTCRLELDNMQLTNKLAADESLIADKDDLAMLKTEKDELIKSKEDITKEISEAKDNLAKVQNELLEAAAELEQARKDADKAKEDKKIDKRFESVLETNEFEVTEQLLLREEEAETLKQQVSKLNQEQEVISAERDELQTQLTDINKERDNMYQQITDLRTERDSLTLQLETSASLSNTIKSERSQLEVKNQELASQIEKLTAAAAAASEEAEKPDLQAKINSLEAERECMAAQVEKLTTEVGNMTSEVKRLEEERKQAEKEAENTKTIQERIVHLEKEIETKKTESSEVQQRLAAQVAEVRTQLEAEQKLVTTKHKEVDATRLDLEKLKTEYEDRISVLTDKLNEQQSNTDDSSKIIELEGRVGGLEKEVATKDSYIKELEDIMVDKEFKISELETKISTSEENEEKREKQKNVDETDNVLLRKELDLKTEKFRSEQDEMEKKVSSYVDQLEEKKIKIEHYEKQISSLEAKLSEVAKDEDWKNKLREERQDLEQKVTRLQQTANILEEREQYISKLEDERKFLKDETEKKNEEVGQLKHQVQDLAQQNQKLLGADTDRASSQISLQQKESEITSLTKKINEIEEKSKMFEQDVSKLQEEKTKLMSHYENIFENKQKEIENLKSRMSGKEIEDQVAVTDDFKELTSKLNDLEQENSDLKAEVSQLVRLQEESKSAHEKEVKRLKKASDMVISEYRDSNKKLSEMTGRSLSPGHESAAVTVTVTDADESDDASLLACTPVVRRTGRGRGRTGGGNRTRAALRLSSQSHQASFEDSNTENEQDSSRNKVTRKPRVNKNRNVSYQEAHPNEGESTTKKRVLREKQNTSTLNLSGGRDNSDSEFVLPSMSTKKKRRLYSTTPQVSAVFTPPTDTEGQGESPHSVVKRQLRSRKKKK